MRRLVERILPWYDPLREAAHNRLTEAVRQRAIAERIRVERVIAEYEVAEARARRDVSRVVDAYRAADDDRRGR